MSTEDRIDALDILRIHNNIGIYRKFTTQPKIPTKQDLLNTKRTMRYVESIGFTDFSVIGKGSAQGAVFLMKMTPANLQAVKRLAKSLKKKYNRFTEVNSLPTTHHVVIKISSLTVNNAASYDEKHYSWVMQKRMEVSMKEIIVLKMLNSTKHVIDMEGCQHSPSSVFPKLYFGGVDEKNGVVISAQSYIPGKTWTEQLKKKTISALTFAHWERAIVLMWVAGITHLDFHSDNAFFDPQTLQTTIIDFGYAQTIPERLRNMVVQQLLEFGRKGFPKTGLQESLWYNGISLKKWADSIMYDGFEKGYNSEGKMLRTAFKYIGDMHNLQDARSIAWRTCPMNRELSQVVTPTPKSSKFKQTKLRTAQPMAEPMDWEYTSGSAASSSSSSSSGGKRRTRSRGTPMAEPMDWEYTNGSSASSGSGKRRRTTSPAVQYMPQAATNEALKEWTRLVRHIREQRKSPMRKRESTSPVSTLIERRRRKRKSKLPRPPR